RSGPGVALCVRDQDGGIPGLPPLRRGAGVHQPDRGPAACGGQREYPRGPDARLRTRGGVLRRRGDGGTPAPPHGELDRASGTPGGMNMHACVESFYDPATATFTHVVYDCEGGHAAIVDSVLDFDVA